MRWEKEGGKSIAEKQNLDELHYSEMGRYI